jgi:hypothetical protein
VVLLEATEVRAEAVAEVLVVLATPFLVEQAAVEPYFFTTNS